MSGSAAPGSRLRILHVIRSGEFAGVEQFVRRLAIAQASAGHHVAVVGGDRMRMRDPLREARVGFAPARRTTEVIASVRAHAHRADVINSHMTSADVGAVLGRGLSRSDPAIVSTRHFAQWRGSLGPRAAYRRLERLIDGEISISDAVAQAIGVPSSVVHPGVAERSAPAAAARDRVVLVAQRLEREKQTDLGIRAFASSGLVTQGWSLHVAGVGAEEVALRRLAVTLGVADAVRFLGFRDDVPARMASAGIFLATCPFEHFGLSVLESMASGLPVVAAAAAGHLETLAGLDPRALFAPGDADAAARSLRALADDRRGRDALGVAEQERQRSRFSLDRQVTQTDAAYRAALGARASREPRS